MTAWFWLAYASGALVLGGLRLLVTLSRWQQRRRVRRPGVYGDTWGRP